MPRDWIAWIRAHAFASSCVSLVCAACLVQASDAPAQPLELPPAQAVAMLGRGVVWFDEGPAFFDGYQSPIAPLGTFTLMRNRPQESVAASASAVAALRSQGGFVGGLPPASLRPIAQPKPVSDGECTGWLPAIRREGESEHEPDFAVVGDELIDTGECVEKPYVVGEEGAALRQPLFVRSLRGGRWRVLRWLPGDRSPILAADGELLAIGEQRSLAKMEVSILDLANGRTVARFGLPDGYLSFASSERLVVSVPTEFWPEEQNFPLGPQVEERHSSPEARLYRLELYSTRGRYIREVGSAGEKGSLHDVLISKAHLISEEFIGEESVLSVRSLAGGAARPVIAFDSPVRKLLTMGFRWPALAVVESTSTPLSASELTCFTGYYHAASKPSLQSFDLAHPEPFAQPPPLAHFEAAVLPKNCPRQRSSPNECRRIRRMVTWGRGPCVTACSPTQQ